MNILNRFWNVFMLKRKEVKFSKDLYISGKIYIHGRKRGIIVGDGVTIHSSENVNPTSGISHTHLRTEGSGKIIIGNMWEFLMPILRRILLLL